ncbi:MAG: hypothetical protein AAFN80_17200 [Pseudomonadota bacterium]
MTAWTLTKTRLFEGVWEGALTSEGAETAVPEIVVTHLQEPLPNIQLQQNKEEAVWTLRVPIPVDRIADGVQTFVISDAATDETLGSFALMSGDALSYDIRAEVTLLREELDMLKRAFRRHCLETM